MALFVLMKKTHIGLSVSSMSLFFKDLKSRMKIHVKAFFSYTKGPCLFICVPYNRINYHKVQEFYCQAQICITARTRCP